MKHSTCDAGELIVSLWENFKEHISDKNKTITAQNMINILINQDLIDNVGSIEEAYGCDSYLDSAIDAILEEHCDNDDEEDDYNDFDE